MNSLNKFHSIVSPLLLLAFIAKLSLILHLGIDGHLFFASQPRVPNTLKVDSGIINLSILVVMDDFSFFVTN